MELITLAQALLRRWWLLVLLGTAGVAVAYCVSTFAPKAYQSTVTLQLNPSARSALLPYGSSDAPYDPNPVSGLAASYQEVLRSRAFGEIVVQRLSLPVAPQIVAGAITGRLVPNTNIFRLTVTWDNPRDAQDLAQAIAEIFVSEAIARQGVTAGSKQRLADMEETARGQLTRLEALRQQRDRLDQAVSRGDLTRIAELNNVEGRLAALETSYGNLLVEINRTRGAMDTASILDRAAPAVPSAALPLSRALPFGLATGLAVAVALLTWLRGLDDTIRGPDDVVAAVGATPLATLGRVEVGRGLQAVAERTALEAVVRKVRNWGQQHELSAPSLIVAKAPTSPSAEMFRVLRANIRLVSSATPCRTIIVTSPSPNEGKSLVACNLALAYAEAGDRVLLVDADLRRPSVQGIFGLESEEGYPDALEFVEGFHAQRNSTTPAAPGSSGERHYPSAKSTELLKVPGVIPTSIDNLSLLLAGHVPPDHTSLLSSDANARLMQRLGELWEVVIIDTSPVIPVADTRLLAKVVDAVIVIARAGATSRTTLSGCLKALEQTGRPPLGVVLNDFRPGPLSRYGPYGYYYHYHHNSYYREARSANGSNRPQRSMRGEPAAPTRLTKDR